MSTSDPLSFTSAPVDPTIDPRGSSLYHEVGAIPFGYANEQLDVYDPANPRHEDHFGMGRERPYTGQGVHSPN